MSGLNPFPRCGSRFTLLTSLLVVMLALFFLLRCGLTLFMWSDIPHQPTTLLAIFTKGILQDLAFVVYALLPLATILLLTPQRLARTKVFAMISKGALWLSMAGLAFILAAEVLFWQEFSTRFNFIAVDYLIYRREVTQNIYESYPMILISLYLLVTATVLFILIKPTLQRALTAEEPLRNRLMRFTILTTLALVALGWLQPGIFTGAQNNYVNELGTNGPYQFIAAFRNNTLDYRSFYQLGNDRELSQLLRQLLHTSEPAKRLYDVTRPIVASKSPRTPNIILITVESLSAKYLDGLHDSSPKYQGLTPFLDKLAKDSLFFSNLYATGTRTTRGLEAITLSMPPTPGRSLVKRPENGPFFSLGGLLKQQGYDTAFLYGGRGFFDNMNSFFSTNGYRIVDEGDFDSQEITFKNAWGVCDGDLYRKTLKEADQISAAGQPFFFHLMTTSNHRPYSYPEGGIAIPSGSGRKGAVRYTDYALKQFFTQAKQHRWFDSTLFVIIADHCAGSAGKVGLPIACYHIPLFIYAPKLIQPTEVTKVASQMDLAPTLLGLLNFSYTSHFFGDNILSPNYRGRALIGNYQKLALYQDNNLVILEPQKKTYLIRQPWQSEQLLSAPSDLSELKDAQAYYQGANYTIHHGWNRLDTPVKTRHQTVKHRAKKTAKSNNVLQKKAMLIKLLLSSHA